MMGKPLLIALLIPTAVNAEISLTAEVDRTVCEVGERITYTATIVSELATPDIQPPEFDGFVVVMGPSTSTSVQIINGAVSRSAALSYVLRAARPGTFIIPPATAVYRGKWYESNTVQVEVLASAAGSSPGTTSDPARRFRNSNQPPEVFITTDTDKDSCYRLEMVTVTYRLYLRVNVNSYNLVKLPQATGFWLEEFEIPSRPPLKDVVIKGIPYKVAEIRRVGLFPTRTGRLTLDPLVAEVTVERPVQRSRSRDPFSSFFDDPFFMRTRQEAISLATDPLEIAVLPLPSEGRPNDFKGDVGDFELRVEYDKRSLAQHDALTVKVTISGEGYLKSVTAPDLNLPEGFESFNPTEEQNIALVGRRMKGKKVFNYLVIPRIAGEFQLPPVQFSYFNPAENRYFTLRDGGGALTISPASGGDAGLTDISPTEVQLKASDIRFIHSGGDLLVPRREPFYTSPLYFVLLASAPLLLLAGRGAESIIALRLADSSAVRRRRALDGFRRTLAGAAKRVKHGRAQETLDHLSRAYAELIGAVIGEPAAGLLSETVTARLREKSIQPDRIEEVVSLLGEADRWRYSGAAPSDEVVENLLKRFASALQTLDKHKLV